MPQLFIILHVFTMQLLFFRIKLYRKLSKFLTIQKSNIRQFSLSGFVAALKPNQFVEKNFMIWRARMELWFPAMNGYHAAQGRPENLAPEDEPKFRAADNLFRGDVISALYPKYEKNYIFSSGKDLWDALEAKFGVSDAESELYLMEQLFGYKDD
jgi:hypothetical protein